MKGKRRRVKHLGGKKKKNEKSNKHIGCNAAGHGSSSACDGIMPPAKAGMKRALMKQKMSLQEMLKNYKVQKRVE